jgi:hypothetical protein
MTHPHERRGEIGGVRRPGPDSHEFWHWLWHIDWAWRRIVPLLAMGLAFYAVLGLQKKIDKTQAQIEAQTQGRQVARQILCGGLNGVEQAGRLILLGKLPAPAPKTPPLSDSEQKLRERYAKSYALVISRRVLKDAGVDTVEVLRDDGTLDCDVLSKITVGITPTPTPSP